MGLFGRLSVFCISIVTFAAGAQTKPPTLTGSCEVALQYEDVAGLRITKPDLELARGRAAEIATAIVDIVHDPHGLPSINLAETFSIDRNASERAANFINNNSLLDRYIAAGEESNPAAEQVNISVDELILRLDQLKGLTSIKVQAIKLASRIPGSSLILGKDPVASVVTIKQQIEAIGRSIDAGIRLMKGNNEELVKLHGTTVDELNLLSKEIIYIQLLKEELDAKLLEDPRLIDDADLRHKVELEVLARLERFSLDQKALHSTLVASTEAISQQLAVNHSIIDGAHRLRRVAQPAIAITASVRIAARDAKNEMAKDDAIRRHVVSAIEEMGREIQANGRTIVELSGRSVIPAEVIAKNMQLLIDERKRNADEMIKVYARNKAESQKFDEILRTGQRVLESQKVGNRMDLMLGGNEEQPRLAPRR